MKKLFTLLALVACFMSASAKEIEDAFVDFSQYSDISEVPRFSWGGAQEAWDRLSIQDGCLHWSSSSVPLNDEGVETSWLAQWFPIGGVDAEVGVTYTLHYKVKGDHNENISALGFGLTPYGQFPITTEWVEGSFDYECSDANGNILMQAGNYIGSFDIAWLKITHEGKEERPVEWKELLTNGDAEKSWEELGLDPKTTAGDSENNYKICFWTKEKGTFDNNEPKEGTSGDAHPAEIVALPEGGHAFICRATLADTEGDAAAWDNQIWIESPRQWKTGEQFKLSFRYKASQAVKTNTQYHKQAPGDYLHWQAIGDVDFTTDWQTFEQVVTVPSEANGAWSVAFNLNPNVKDPTDFYIDDLSWAEMVLDHGYFVTGTNTESGLVDYDFDNAIPFEYDAEVDAYKATIGTAGKQDSWVNEVMISTVRGNDRQFKANTLNPDVAEISDPLSGDESWGAYTETASKKIALPAAGVWTIYLDEGMHQMAFLKIEGEESRVPLDITPNTTEIIVNGVEREYTTGENGDAPEGYEFQKDENGTDIVGQPWDNQLIIMANRALKAGEELVIEFDYWATIEANTNTQCGAFGNPGGYVFWNALGDVLFTAEKQHFSKEYTVPGDADGFGAWNFNMAVIKAANDYHVTNVIWKTKDNYETLIDMEGGKNFYIKTGAGTSPAPIEDNAIHNVNTTVANSAIYNVAGQRVANSFKGIAIQNGHKFIQK